MWPWSLDIISGRNAFTVLYRHTMNSDSESQLNSTSKHAMTQCYQARDEFKHSIPTILTDWLNLLRTGRPSLICSNHRKQSMEKKSESVSSTTTLLLSEWVSEYILNGTSAQLGYSQYHLHWFMLDNTGQKTNYKYRQYKTNHNKDKQTKTTTTTNITTSSSSSSFRRLQELCFWNNTVCEISNKFIY